MGKEGGKANKALSCKEETVCVSVLFTKNGLSQNGNPKKRKPKKGGTTMLSALRSLHRRSYGASTMQLWRLNYPMEVAAWTGGKSTVLRKKYARPSFQGRPCIFQ